MNVILFGTGGLMLSDMTNVLILTSIIISLLLIRIIISFF